MNDVYGLYTVYMYFDLKFKDKNNTVFSKLRTHFNITIQIFDFTYIDIMGDGFSAHPCAILLQSFISCNCIANWECTVLRQCVVGMMGTIVTVWTRRDRHRRPSDWTAFEFWSEFSRATGAHNRIGFRSQSDQNSITIRSDSVSDRITVKF